MRIGIFLDEWRDGGVPVFLERLEKYFTANGQEVFLFLAQPHPKRDPMSRQLYLRLKQRLGDRCVPLDLLSYPPPWRAARFQEAVFSRNISCLFLNHFYHHNELLATFAAQIPLVSIAHNDGDSYYHEYLRSRHLTRAHVAVSQRILEKTLVMTEPASAGHIRHIPYGVEETARRFQPAVTGPLRVIYSARLDPVQKRCDDLVPIWKNYIESGGTGLLTILGSGKHATKMRDDFREELQTGGVVILGHLPAHEALDQVAQADVLLNLSNFEGLPQVVLEGATLGLFPLLSDIESGHREIVAELGAGTLIHVGDVPRFAAELLRLERDLPALRRQRLQIHERALAHYSFDQCGRRYLSLVHEVAAKAPAPRPPDLPNKTFPQRLDRLYRWLQYRRHFSR